MKKLLLDIIRKLAEGVIQTLDKIEGRLPEKKPTVMCLMFEPGFEKKLSQEQHDYLQKTMN